MYKWIARLLPVSLLAIPLLAIGDNATNVTMATPGGAHNTVERYTLRFSRPMVPLGDPRAPAPASVKCAVDGTGRWSSQDTWIYEFQRSLPGGIKCTVQLNDGLRSASGDLVAGATQYAIDTRGPGLRAVFTGPETDEIEEDQVFLVATNEPALPQSVAQNAYCAIDGLGEKIPVDVLPPETAGNLLAEYKSDTYSVNDFLQTVGIVDHLPQAGPDRIAATATITALKCRRPLPGGRDMSLIWPGKIIGKSGMPAKDDDRADFTVRKAFSVRVECKRTNPQAGCIPVQPIWVRFSGPVPAAVAKAVRVRTSDGREIAPVISDDDRSAATLSDLKFAGPFPALSDVQVVLPNDVRDESGRVLTNAARFPLAVRIDADPPLVKFAAPFGIIEANAGATLPVTVRAVEPTLEGKFTTVGGGIARIDDDEAAVARWLRRLDDADDNDIRDEKVNGKEVSVNYTGATSVFAMADAGEKPAIQPMKLTPPAGGKAFEVVGIPLAKPGFYVVELASPALGQALLGRKATRYVAAGALVTNMAVHFKWGREGSLAWVTALDSGTVVAGAAVRVADSCTGKILAQGSTDNAGRLMIRGGLPEPTTSGSCRPDDDHALIVTARKDGDFTFTMTEWGSGIQPWDFDMRYGWSKPGDIVHTIFDRTLIRQGETVQMKHLLRRPVLTGFSYGTPIKGQLILSHDGSDTEFSVPVAIGADGVAETSWTAPKSAPLGTYNLSIKIGKDNIIYTDQSVRVDEFRLPTMRATISGPKDTLIRPRELPADLFVGYLSGGGAGNMPVSVRAAFSTLDSAPDGYDDWTFGGRPLSEGITPLNSEGDEDPVPTPPSQLLPVTLNAQGAGRAGIAMPASFASNLMVAVEMDYQDANGETLTASRRIPVYAAGVQLGIKPDGWIMKQDDVRLKFVALDTNGNPVRGQKVSVELFSREILSARRRLIGGFYAFDNKVKTTRLNAGCSITTDKLGLGSCAVDPGVSGEIYVMATTTDRAGNVARTVSSLWVAGDDDWWFGGDNGDRMDLIPEKKEYAPGDKARFQVRMPFREATALVTVEREGVIDSFVTTLRGTDPVITVPLNGSYAPDVHVSVMAVRGRVNDWKSWFADKAKQWNLPFLQESGGATALVDLAKPAFRMGMAKIRVGWSGHRLAVTVKPSNTRYAIRDTAPVDITVRRPDGKPAAGAEIAFAAVDEAILNLSPNDSWDVLSAMMGDRPVEVLTSTGQTQVVGKRHYGRKAVAAGGGGGGDLSAVNRTDFRPVLLWKGRVTLDSAGRAHVDVPMSDSLSSFRFVAVATDGPNLFGTGDQTVRTGQDLQIMSGVPPLVREGDQFDAVVTLRNGTDKPITATATATVAGLATSLAPQTVTIPAGGATPVTWSVAAPDGAKALAWQITAKSTRGQQDMMSFSQQVIAAVPLETWASTLVAVSPTATVPIQAPAGALAGRSLVEVRLANTLAPPLDGVRDYMTAYPYGCFEQQTSRSIALGDTAIWDRLVADMPAYLDKNGLLRYFPYESMDGSAVLTAYILSVADEAKLVIPAEHKARMIKALTAVVEGRLQNDFFAQSDARALKVSALAALARHGQSSTRLINLIGLPPQSMATTTLADWLIVIDRTPGLANRAALRTAAEAALRTRITYEGTRFDLTDGDRAPWWYMSSADEMRQKVLLAVMGRAGWENDVDRLMIGAAAAQQRGHWDTTVANAWGVLAARKFAAMHPVAAITGTTVMTLGTNSQQRPWGAAIATAADAPFVFPIADAAPAVPLVLKQASGSAGPWAFVTVKAAVPLTRPLFAGYKVDKKIDMIQQQVAGRMTRGDVMKVTLTVTSSAERNWVVISDPIPAGATIVSDLGGQSQLLANAANEGWPSYVERGQDSWRGYYGWMPEGRYTMSYVVRLNNAGRFTLPATRVEAMYAPEIRAQLPNAPMTIAAR